MYIYIYIYIYIPRPLLERIDLLWTGFGCQGERAVQAPRYV